MFFRRAFSASAVLGFGWGGAGHKETFVPGQLVQPHITVLRPEKAKTDVLLSRKIVNELDKTGLNLRLYQYETCPFCCKVRAFLDYYGFSYEVVEVNPVTRSQIKFSTDYRKVPILRVHNATSLTESSLIISQLATFIALPDRTLEEVDHMYPAVETTDPATGKPTVSHPNKYFVMHERTTSAAEMAAAKEEREWREWVDAHFIHLISPNVYRTWNESLATFQWFQEVGEWHRTFPSWERCLAVYIGAAAMFALSKRLKKRHNIDDERAAMKDACDKWMAALGNRPFMGGDRPNLADLALYGAMQSFYGCATFKECCSSGPIADWYARMKGAVERREGASRLTARAAAT